MPLTDKELTYHRTLTIVGGLAAALFYGQQILVFKSVSRYIRDQYAIAFSFTVFGSLYGLGSLAYILCFYPELFSSYSTANYLSALISGILISLGIVFINVASDMGNAGICNAIMHSQRIFLTLGNYAFFGQTLNLMQGMGVILSVIGAAIISLPDLCHRKRVNDILYNRNIK
jgi:drug/metabolite transporter (DMT)-like permease